jgi:prophage regulatory protein
MLGEIKFAWGVQLEFA